jgi:flagellar hook protein FlgE
MSISSAMLAGVTGLVSNASSLAAISDNIANSNTVGYKRSTVDFTSLVNTGSHTAYTAGGVVTATRGYIGQQGTLQSSANVTDLAISGSGFFVTSAKSVGLTAADPRYFTRAGAFTVDQNGYMKNAAGLFLQGWPADTNGTVNPDSANLSSLTPINIFSVTSTAQPTTTASVDGNLNTDQTINVGEPAYALGDLATYAGNNTLGLKPDFSITVPVSDSKGGQRNVVVDFLKSSTPNQWHAEVRADPLTVVDNLGGGQPQGMIMSGVMAFNPDGSIDTVNTTLPSSFTLGDSAAGADPKWTASLGVDAQTIALDLTGMTQFSGVSSVSAVASNGTATGGISGVTIDDQGLVTAVYGNGTMRTIAQVAVATFPNANGLKTVNGNAYQASLESGIYTLNVAGSGGAGAIAPSSLEASTVDLSTEFTGLITTQRAYSASSKIITTADQMLEELLSIKR